MAYYLELFDGDPEDDGASVMEAITGSSARQDVTDDMVLQTLYTGAQRWTNPDYITIAAASESTTNVSFVALYDEATDGTIQFTHAIGATRVISIGNLVQFPPVSLNFAVVSGEGPFDMITEAGILMISEASVQMVTQAG